MIQLRKTKRQSETEMTKQSIRIWIIKGVLEVGASSSAEKATGIPPLSFRPKAASFRFRSNFATSSCPRRWPIRVASGHCSLRDQG